MFHSNMCVQIYKDKNQYVYQMLIKVLTKIVKMSKKLRKHRHQILQFFSILGLIFHWYLWFNQR